MEIYDPDEFRETLDKCTCGRKPKVRRQLGYVMIRCPNPNCRKRIKAYKREWQAMVGWNKMVREGT